MEIERRPSYDFIQYIESTLNNPKYQNETLPAIKFVDRAEKYLGVDIKKFKENKNDPPDFDIFLSTNETIGLEVTAFLDKKIQKYNSFFKKIKSLIAPIIKQNISLLPSGIYEFYYFPGSEDYVELKNSKIEIPDFRFKINKSELKVQLEKRIPIWFKDYNENDKTICSITNSDGNQVGKIHLIKFRTSKETKFFITPQRCVRMKEWTGNELENELQKIVNNKEIRYLQGGSDWSNRYSQRWLLISDIHDTMGTSSFEINLDCINLSTGYFNRIFLIQDLINDHRIININIKR